MSEFEYHLNRHMNGETETELRIDMEKTLLSELRVTRQMYAECRHSVLVEALIDHAGWTREEMLAKARALIDRRSKEAER